MTAARRGGDSDYGRSATLSTDSSIAARHYASPDNAAATRVSIAGIDRVRTFRAGGEGDIMSNAPLPPSVKPPPGTARSGTSASRFNPDLLPVLRAISRGAHHEGGLDAAQSRLLMRCMLRRELSDAQAGAALLGLRMKGESADELEGFARELADALPTLPRPGRPVAVIPSMNGARRLPNQVPLLALLLRRCGIPALVLGTEADDGRVHTAALWRALGMVEAPDLDAAGPLLAAGEPVYLDLDTLHDGLGWLLRWRGVLGLRNFGHSVSKLIAPVDAPSLLVTSYTHREFAATMAEVLRRTGQPALLLRGCEGEAVANPNRPGEMQTISRGMVARTIPADDILCDAPPLPDGRDPDASAEWIRATATGANAVPLPLRHQAQLIAGLLEDAAFLAPA